MSTTIFCNFEQQDLADLAIGKLRAATAGIKSIHYIAGYNQNQSAQNSADSSTVWNGVFGIGQNVGQPMPSRPVTVKIVCSDASANAVVSKLVNLRAYQIIKTR